MWGMIEWEQLGGGSWSRLQAVRLTLVWGLRMQT